MERQTTKWLLVIMVSLLLNSFETVSKIKIPVATANTMELKDFFQDVYTSSLASFVGVII
tara:strand:+ start:161 stop:340 length:180 start_codon:yes stop_codon:yes gene_type:complete